MRGNSTLMSTCCSDGSWILHAGLMAAKRHEDSSKRFAYLWIRKVFVFLDPKGLRIFWIRKVSASRHKK